MNQDLNDENLINVGVGPNKSEEVGKKFKN